MRDNNLATAGTFLSGPPGHFTWTSNASLRRFDCVVTRDVYFQSVNYLPRFRFHAKPSHASRLLV
eukprot:6910612-Pyramimonas_sp.AAC.1